MEKTSSIITSKQAMTKNVSYQVRYDILERDGWFSVCRDFKKIFRQNWLHFQDVGMTTAFGYAMIDIFALERLVSPKEGESMQDAVKKKYGDRGLEFIKRVL